MAKQPKHKAKRETTAIDYSEAVDAFAAKLVEIRANIVRIVDDEYARPSLREIDAFLTLERRFDSNALPEPVQDAIWSEMWRMVAEHGRGWWA